MRNRQKFNRLRLLQRSQSFKEDSAAREVVNVSPHTIIDTEVICDFKKGKAKVAKGKAAKRCQFGADPSHRLAETHMGDILGT